MRKPTKQAAARKKGKCISFAGLDVRISERILSRWKNLPASIKGELYKKAAKAKSRWYFLPMERSLRKEMLEEKAKGYEKPSPIAELSPYQPVWIPPIMSLPEDERALIEAYREGRANDVRTLADRKAKRVQAARKRSKDSISSLDERKNAKRFELTQILFEHWLVEDGLCLAWFSMGALDLLLGATGLHSVKMDGTEAIKKRINRTLGLRGIVPALIEKRDVEIDGKMVILR